MSQSETIMTPPQQHVHRQTQPSITAQKVELTYKLFLLENARDKLEHELRNVINKAYKEVQGFLNSSFPTNVFSDLANTLDMKCQALDKLSASLKNLYMETELWDIGDIFTEVGQINFEKSPLEKRDCHYTIGQMELSSLNIQIKNETVHCTEPKKGKNSVPVLKSIKIPEFQSQRFEETEVVVSHIVSPGNFYIQHADSIMKLEALVTDSWKVTSSYALQNCIPDIGTQVMCWFPKQEQWCRAQVMPVNGRDWTEEAVGWFKAMVSNRILYARLYPQGPKVTVELFLEKGKLGAMRRSPPLSLRLAQNGHAKHNNLKNVGHMKRS
ncbi:hypothetical protein EXN66_Car009430 [Channa argus]|uniref:Tudor domain-containing protein n=1 Tax=Channa argus TaxID=215402 RepID=A0A6G1PUD6_CHAAH|nr:hypothetical protein EXN66_Car009430 [Channa argus]